MTSQNFCYWLQGKLEIDGKPQALTSEQVAVIAKHLALVFKHEIDPSQGPPAHQEELNEIHSGKSKTQLLEEKVKELEEKLKQHGHAHKSDVLIRC